MNLAIIDLETTTADVETARIVEIGVCVWSVEHRIVTAAFSTTVHCNENPAEAVNGIPVAALTEASPLERAFATVGHFVGKADVIAAHNGDGFDRPILDRHACPWVAPKPWIDTMDVEWPKVSSSRALIQLAAAHGVPIGTVHRAIDDVLLVARLFERAAELGADVPAMIERAMRPKVLVVAEVSFDEREKAKAAGFRWDVPTKTWRRSMPREDIAGLGFSVREVAA